MALSVDYSTKIISVPQADLISLGGGLYELDTNIFRLGLKDWEDNTNSIYMPDTHSHNTTVLLGGIEYARIIEIINGYTITFEDGQYAVNIVGSNNNIADVTNVNQVSIRPNNSAGLIQTREIQYASFNGGVTINADIGITGTYYPIGTQREPSNNFTDAYFIANLNGFNTFYLNSDLTLSNASPVLNGFDFVGVGGRNSITLEPDANVFDCAYFQLNISGTLDGNSLVRECFISVLDYVNGVIEGCVILDTITLGGGTIAHILDSWSGVAGEETPIIDMGGSGQSLALRNYSGGIKLINKTGTESISIDLNSGQVILDNTVTNGKIVCRGDGKLIDVNGDEILSGTWNGVTIINETINAMQISHYVWGDLLVDNRIAGSMGEKLGDISSSAVTPQDIVDIVDGVWSKDVSAYVAGTSGRLQYNTGYVEKSIFIDTERAINGDGTAGSPFNNIDDAKTHAEDSNITSIITYSELTLTSSFKNFIIRGLAGPVVDTNNQDISGSEFYHCTMRGLYIATKPISGFECNLDDGFQLTGGFKDCVISGIMNVIGGAVVKNCSSGIAGLSTPTFNMNTGLATSLSIRGWSGGILIQNCDHADDVATLEISQGRVFIDNTNTDGLISIRGVAFFEDTSAGTIIETSGLLDPSKSQLTTEEQDRLFETLTLKKYIALK